MSEQKKKKYCVDCGGAQVNHNLAFLSIWLSNKVEPWTSWMDNLIPEDKLEWIGPILTRILVILHLGKYIDKPENKDSLRARVLWEEANKRGIIMKEFLSFFFLSKISADRI